MSLHRDSISRDKTFAKKYRKLPVKNCLLFISCRVSQWQYKKAMPSALEVAPKKHQQAFHVQEAEML